MKQWDRYHPYKPYDIQVELMDAIYDTLDKNLKIGIFESPTGTGKTLSLICSTMTWLRDYKRKNTFEDGGGGDNDVDKDEAVSDDEPDWVNDCYEKTVIARSKAKIVDYELYLDKVELDYGKELVSELPVKKRRFGGTTTTTTNDEDLLPLDYYSDSESTVANVELQNSLVTKQINQLLQKPLVSESAPSCPINIYFSSRTHSQLNQFASQLTLPHFDSSFNDINERIKYIPMGGRNQLCIHDKISKYNSDSINDACIDLQKKSGCEFKHNNNTDDDKKFIDLTMTRIHDIEDLAQLGKQLKICPYYSIRSGLQVPEIVSLPYQMLLQQSTRDIINLNIENSIIIIDEAHNLIDTITGLYSVALTLHELTVIIASLKLYLSKFIKRLNSGNRINLSKLIKLCQILQTFIEKSVQNNTATIGQHIPQDSILCQSNADLHNIHKLDNFLSKTKIAYKIESYIEKLNQTNNANNDRNKPLSSPLLFKIIKFLKCLNHPSKEGRFFWSETNNQITINYMLLDPAPVFSEIVSRAKCIILCGGTMEPINEFFDYLFPQIPKNQIKTFKCGHIIPPENLKVFPIKNWQNSPFEFSFGKRNDRKMIGNLGDCIIDLCKSIPAGVVIFFPSYNYLNQVIKIWQDDGKYDKMLKLKQIFQEPTESNKVEQILQNYSHIIKQDGQGSLLLSVVGGKMSEGINFSDDLARAIIMIGLPYPNAYSGEIIAKRKFIETKTLENGGTKIEAQQRSQNFYENICMRAINQSIGRSIRHAKDYSIIYLIDQRFEQPRIQNKLSGWVRDRIVNDNPTNLSIIDQTKAFFMSKSISTLN